MLTHSSHSWTRDTTCRPTETVPFLPSPMSDTASTSRSGTFPRHKTRDSKENILIMQMMKQRCIPPDLSKLVVVLVLMKQKPQRLLAVIVERHRILNWYDGIDGLLPAYSYLYYVLLFREHLEPNQCEQLLYVSGCRYETWISPSIQQGTSTMVVPARRDNGHGTTMQLEALTKLDSLSM